MIKSALPRSGRLVFQCVSVIKSNKMSALLKSCNVAVCQLTATNNKEENLQKVKSLVAEAAQKDAKMVFLPEGCDYIGESVAESRALAEPLDGSLMSEYKKLAQTHGVWLSIGGFHEIKNKDDPKEKLNNAHVLINSHGNIEAVYRKLHLFDVSVPEENLNLEESSYANRGEELVSPVDSPIGPLSLSICYDLRFPEQSVLLRKLGASILTFPSAFTSKTGEAHWETLLRARAIENQCYVIAAAQYGRHNPKRTSYGNAMIVDPWGKVVAACPKYVENVTTNESLAVAAIDPNLIVEVRKRMPVLEHRRNDIYSLSLNSRVDSTDQDTYLFSDKIVPASAVFYRTKFSYAFTNIRCVVPGHVLVSSIRVAKRLEDLTQEEVADFFQVAVRVQGVMEKVQGVGSTTLCVQDGKEAGQTVSHVHCHILPRRKGDFPRNDDIYDKLAMHDRNDNPDPIRSVEEMSAEAEMLRPYFN